MLSRVVNITKTESAYVVRPTNMSAMSLLFESPGIDCKHQFSTPLGRADKPVTANMCRCHSALLFVTPHSTYVNGQAPLVHSSQQ